MFRKKLILPYTALTVSLLLLIAAVIDLFSAITLFQTVPFRLAVAAMLLLSFGVTFLACFSAEMRRPLILLACLLQTPIGGGMALVLVYDLCYPDQLQMDVLLPILTVLVAFASAVQSAVLLLCKSIEADEGGIVYTAARSTDDDLRPIANAPRRKAAAPVQTADWDEEDDLSPVSRKRKRRTYTDAPQEEDVKHTEQPVTFTAVDLLSLFDEEGTAEQSANADVPAQEQEESAAPQESPAAENESSIEDAVATAAEDAVASAVEDAVAQTPVDAEQSCPSDSTEPEPAHSDS